MGTPEPVDPALASTARRVRRIILVVLLLVAVLGVGLGVSWYRSGLWGPHWGPQDATAVCPVQQIAPAAAEDTVVNVYNAGAADGAATRTGERLERRGFVLHRVANAQPEQHPGEHPAIVVTGPRSVEQALAVQRQVAGTVVVLQPQRSDGTVDLVLGEDFRRLVPAKKVRTNPGRLECARQVFGG